jgi:AcrR family transcriptional regulator
MIEQKIYKPSVQRLIDAAERLIGQHGFDGVSLQQIAVEAGHSNKFAVQYHFGSKNGVVDAVFATRLPRIDERRRKIFEALKANKRELTVRTLFWVLFQPVYDEVDSQGAHAYARFAAQIRHLPREREFWASTRHLASEVFELLHQRTPHLSKTDFDMRFSLAIDIFTGALRLLDDDREYSLSNETPTIDPDRLMSHTFDMCAAALECPVSSGVDDLA